MIVRREDGAGGKYMSEFLKKYVFSKISSKAGEISLEDMEDSADFSENFVFTTDSYTVKPPIFRGGSIGSLSICGTANDLAVVGAKPSCMSLSLIIQEGFEIEKLEKIIEDISRARNEVGVEIITGDTKVVEADIGIFVNTSGIGERSKELEENLEVVRSYREYPFRWIRDRGAEEEEAVIVSGSIAEHGLTILLERESLNFEIDISSDVYPVWKFVREALKVGGITSMKDPTRGGLANALNEIAEKSGVGILVEEERIPIREDVKFVCETLGLDPLSMANEGKVVMTVVKDLAEDVLQVLKKFDENAEIIGYTTKEFGEVVMKTRIGTMKVVPPPVMDPVPRVC